MCSQLFMSSKYIQGLIPTDTKERVAALLAQLSHCDLSRLVGLASLHLAIAIFLMSPQNC